MSSPVAMSLLGQHTASPQRVQHRPPKAERVGVPMLSSTSVHTVGPPEVIHGTLAALVLLTRVSMLTLPEASRGTGCATAVARCVSSRSRSRDWSAALKAAKVAMSSSTWLGLGLGLGLG